MTELQCILSAVYVPTGKTRPLLLPAEKATLGVKGHETEFEDTGELSLSEAEQVSLVFLVTPGPMISQCIFTVNVFKMS